MAKPLVQEHTVSRGQSRDFNPCTVRGESIAIAVLPYCREMGVTHRICAWDFCPEFPRGPLKSDPVAAPSVLPNMQMSWHLACAVMPPYSSAQSVVLLWLHTAIRLPSPHHLELGIIVSWYGFL